MKLNNEILRFFSLLVVMFFAILAVNASGNFSITPINFNEQVNVSSSYSNIFTITNTGSESLNLTLFPSNLSLGSDNLSLNLNKLSIVNLSAGNSTNVSFNFTAGSVVGSHLGNILVYQTENSSLNQTVNFNISIVNPSLYNFSITPINFNEQVNVSSNYSNIFMITNTGSNSLNLTLFPSNLSLGSNNLSLNLNKLSIVNLSAGNSTNVSFNFTVGSVVGSHLGNILVYQTENSSLNQTVNFNISVVNNSVEVGNESIVFKNYPSDILTMNVNIDDSSKSQTFYLQNNGNLPITNVKFDLDSTFRVSGNYIDDNDFEINGEDGQDTYDSNDDSALEKLAVGDEYRVRLYLDIPSNLIVDEYRGDIKVTYTIDGQVKTKYFNLRIITESNNDNIYFKENSLYVKSGIFKVFAEPGESVNNLYLELKNDASYDVNNLDIRFKSDLIEENSNNILPKTSVVFDDDSYDINSRDDQKVYFDLNIPDNQPTGTYSTDVKLYSNTGKELDKIPFKVEVIGDIYVKSVDYKSSYNPGEYMDVDVVVRNKGSSIQRNVKVTGSIFDIDSSNSDLHESSSNFLLDSNTQRTVSLRFKIPDDATDGSHVFEIKTTYDNSEISKVEDVEVLRPSHKIEIDSNAINPRVLKCDSKLYTYMKVQNLGKYDDSIQMTSEIVGTGVLESTSIFDIAVDEITQKSLVLDVSNLKAGSYKVVQTVKYNNVLKLTRESDLRVDDCSNVTAIVVNKLNSTNLNINESNINVSTSNNNFDIFGRQVEKTTAYLGVGVGGVTILIIIALFLL